MTPGVKAAIARGQSTAALVELERARLYGAADSLVETVGLTAALVVLDSVKARLVAARQGQEGWVA
jgi:hypothetical protein